jgi:hypothetical protein
MIRLSDLFGASKEIDLPKGLKGQARALTDGEIKERRRYAILHSQKATEEIKDESSDAYRLLIAPFKQEKQKAPLVDVVMQVRRIEFVRDALAFIPNVLIPLPDDANDTQEREILERRKVQDKEVQEKRAAMVEKRTKDVRQKLTKLNVGRLRLMAQQAIVGVYEQAASYDAVQWYTIHAGVYVYEGDKLERLFPSPEAVRDHASGPAVARLFGEVEEVNGVDPWEIAKNA